ncbi:unnamed protein product [Zymoseptoria tritici ST99CH_1A5]|uniref:Uncharacterized protein n=1 Tax=Zymoseptoria tritici ST99CH_1A5 TaxID=1276529 RepID=A0A1Y6L5H2_ZYMTR|nr:unnamed protein product [Zymoseptoria tritici ST99CH_1A5]
MAPPTTPKAAPAPRPFKPESPEARHSRVSEMQPPEPMDVKPKRKSLFLRLWPSKPQEPVYLGSSNPERGIEAARRYVKEGVLDKRYAGAASRATALICALPIAIYLSWELYQRRFNGKERKRVAQLPTEDSP